MENKENIYVSLDEAREELARRRQDKELMKKIEADLGDRLWPIFKGRPCGVLPKYLPSPDNSFTFFIQMANFIGTVPVVVEFLGDKFVSFNEEKKGLGRLRVRSKNGEKFTVDVVDFQKNENKKINEIVTKTGQSLVDFHHDLLDKFGYGVEMEDGTHWLHEAGKKIDYYGYLLNFVVHGVLFEYYTEEDEYEKVFVHETVLPNIKKIYDKYGLKPLIIKLFPENQNDEEDFYWWSYPLAINDFIIEYAKQHGLPLKPFVIDECEEENAINLDDIVGNIENPDVMFQKIMAIKNGLMVAYCKACRNELAEELKEEIKSNLQNAKIKLAYEIVKKYHGEAGAEKAKTGFLKMISENGIPSEILDVAVGEDAIKLGKFLVLAELVTSVNDAHRKIEQGGVQINGQKELDKRMMLSKSDDGSVFKVGKFGFAKIKFL